MRLSRRTPPGVRELKRSWRSSRRLTARCRTPPGVRELKHVRYAGSLQDDPRRTPPGVRELKQEGLHHVQLSVESHPSRGA